MPDLRELRSVELGGLLSLGGVAGGRLVTTTKMSRDDEDAVVRAWPLPVGEPNVLARSDWPQKTHLPVDATDTWLGYGRGLALFRRRVDVSGPSQEQAVGQLGDEFVHARFAPAVNGLLSFDKSREIRLWSLAENARSRILDRFGGHGILAAETDGSLVAFDGDNGIVALSDLRDPADAGPIALKRPKEMYWLEAAFESSGSWLATNNGSSVAFWPLRGPWMRTLRGRPRIMKNHPDGMRDSSLKD